MIQQADDIIVATAIHSHPELMFNGNVMTVNELRVEQVLKGQTAPGDSIELYELGGFMPRLGIGMNVPGMPRDNGGRPYLVFTTPLPDGHGATLGLARRSHRVR